MSRKLKGAGMFSGDVMTSRHRVVQKAVSANFKVSKRRLWCEERCCQGCGAIEAQGGCYSAVRADLYKRMDFTEERVEKKKKP